MEDGMQSDGLAGGIRLRPDGVSRDGHFGPANSSQIVKNSLRLCLRYVWRPVCNRIVVVAP
jgi:hypothetical protein